MLPLHHACKCGDCCIAAEELLKNKVLKQGPSTLFFCLPVTDFVSKQADYLMISVT